MGREGLVMDRQRGGKGYLWIDNGVGRVSYG